MSSIISTSLFLVLFIAQSCGSNKLPVPSENTTTPSTNQRSLKNTNDKTYPIKEYTETNNLGQYAQAIFAGGCFWCTEAAFERIEGVVDVISGYAGGHKEYPTYAETGTGKTGHTESIYIYYDSAVISYETLLDVLFVAHDPTTLNSQGPDHGEEYRSAIFYKSEKELEVINNKIEKLNQSDTFTNEIVTEVSPYKEFWVAEGYHQNYYELHPKHPYVSRVSKPKVLKVSKKFNSILKAKYK